MASGTSEQPRRDVLWTAAHDRLHAHIAGHIKPDEQAELLAALLALRHNWRAPLIMIDYRSGPANLNRPSIRLIPCRNAAARMLSAQASAMPSFDNIDTRTAFKGDNPSQVASCLASRLMASVVLAWPSYAHPARMIAYSDGAAIAFCPEAPGIEWPTMLHASPNPDRKTFVNISPARSTGLLAALMTDLTRKMRIDMFSNQ